MQVAAFSAKSYDRQFLDRANAGRHELRFIEARLSAATAPLAQGAGAVCLFANDHADAGVIDTFAGLGVRRSPFVRPASTMSILPRRRLEESLSACDYAKARGFKLVHSVELADNRFAIALEEEMGFTARPCAEDMSLTVLTKRLAA